jgi:hypothetical protein
MFESPFARRSVLAASFFLSSCATLDAINRSDCMESSEFSSPLMSWRTYDGENEGCKKQKHREAVMENLTLFANIKRPDGSDDLAARALALRMALKINDPAMLEMLKKQTWFQLEKLKQESSCTAGAERKNADGSVTQDFYCTPVLAAPAPAK